MAYDKNDVMTGSPLEPTDGENRGGLSGKRDLLYWLNVYWLSEFVLSIVCRIFYSSDAEFPYPWGLAIAYAIFLSGVLLSMVYLVKTPYKEWRRLKLWGWYVVAIQLIGLVYHSGRIVQTFADLAAGF